MAQAEELAAEIARLPTSLRDEVADFVAFIKLRHLSAQPAAGQHSAQPVGFSAATTSDLYRSLEAAGLVGCIDTDDQAAAHYKTLVDYSGKTGRKP